MHRVDHATKPFSTDDVLEADRLPFGQRGWSRWRSVVSTGMGASLVVVLGEFGHEVVEMILAEGDEMVEAFRLDHLNKSLDPGIEVG